MDETMDKKRPLSDLMRSTMDKIREMADTNTIVGQPITTPDGVTLIPISRVSMGFGCGGADYGKTQPKDFGGGSGAGVKIEPVAFLVIREGTTRVLPVAMPPMTTLDRVVEMIRRFGALYPDKKITFCLDVSYIDFDDTFENTRRIFDCIRDMPENSMTLVVFSMSKSYTMCGMRCGALVCLGETKEAAERFKAAMSYSSRSVWSNVVRMAQRILVDINLNPEVKRQADTEREKFRDLISRRGETFYGEAKRVGLKCCPYKHGYFIAIPCKNPAKAAEILCGDNVFVVPQARGLRFSPCAVTTEKCLRAPEIIRRAIEKSEEETK